jgi:hypothetical protein
MVRSPAPLLLYPFPYGASHPLSVCRNHRRDVMKAKNSEPTIELDKKLKLLVKRSVESCDPTSEAWSHILHTIQKNQPPARSPREVKTALTFSE